MTARARRLTRADILVALHSLGGASAAARFLGIARSTVRRRLAPLSVRQALAGDPPLIRYVADQVLAEALAAAPNP